MNCSKCQSEMKQGWLALFNPIGWLTFVVWQPLKPGYIRLFKPKNSVKVITPKAFGKGCPKAYVCKNCKMVTFSYATEDLD